MIFYLGSTYETTCQQQLWNEIDFNFGVLHNISMEDKEDNSDKSIWLEYFDIFYDLLKKIMVSKGTDGILESFAKIAQTNDDEVFLTLIIVLYSSFYREKLFPSAFKKTAEILTSLIQKTQWTMIKSYAISSQFTNLFVSTNNALPFEEYGILDILMDEINPNDIETGISAANLIKEIIRVDQEATISESKVLEKISAFLMNIKQNHPMPEFLSKVIYLVNEFTLPCFEDDPIQLLCEMIKHSSAYSSDVLKVGITKLASFAKDSAHLLKMAEANLIPDLKILAQQEKFEEVVLKFMWALVVDEESRKQMLEHEIYDFSFKFLIHEQLTIRKKMVEILRQIICSQKSNFLTKTAVIEQLFKMLKQDTLEINQQIISMLIYLYQDNETKLKFWLAKDIIGELETLLLNETEKTFLLMILDCLDELSAVGSSSASPENVIDLRVKQSLIPNRRKEIQEQI